MKLTSPRKDHKERLYRFLPLPLLRWIARAPFGKIFTKDPSEIFLSDPSVPFGRTMVPPEPRI